MGSCPLNRKDLSEIIHLQYFVGKIIESMFVF
jgi:hypothetical protein